MSNLRLSLLITFFASNGATAISFLVTIILARLLSPAEIGIFSIAAVLVSIAHIFRDFGVGVYLKQEKELTPEKIRAASGVLITSSWTIALGLYLLSREIAEYYQRPEVEGVVSVLALGFVFIPFGAITHTLLTREYRAKEQALANAFGITSYAISSILLAYLGFGHMTMAWANLVNIIVTGLVYIPFRPSYAPWRPSLRGWKQVIHFGSGAILGNSVEAINKAIPDIVLGKLSGPYDVGIMSRANGTTNIFLQIAGPTINYATLPHLAQKHHLGEPLGAPLMKATSYLTVCAWPAIIFIAIFAKEIILFLYGLKWIECVPIVRITCVTLLFSTPFTFSTPALMAIGRPYLSAIPGGISLAAKMVFIILLYNGSLNSFAYALLASTVLALPVSIWLQAKYLDFGTRPLLAATTKSSAITFALMMIGLAIHHECSGLQPVIQLSIAAIIMIPIWVFMVKLINHPILEELITASLRFPLLGRFL